MSLPDTGTCQMKRLFAAFTIAACAVPGTAAAQVPLEGRIFDAYTQSPLAEVRLTSGGASVSTGARGDFTLRCSPGMTLVLTRVGYESYETVVDDCGEALQVGLTPSFFTLNGVDVVASRGGSNLEQPVSVSVLSQRELERNSGIFLEDAVNLTPGVRMEKRTMAGGHRITIRGYGTASNFIGTGYKAYLNGIPITDAEGQTVLDDIDFATLGKVEVIRGPASSLYGAGIGGVVNLYTLRPQTDGTVLSQDVTGGSDGLLRTNTRLETSSSGASVLVNYGHQNYDSYRIHSGSRKDHATFLGDFRPSTDRTITTYLNYAHSFDERAGQLDSIAFFGRANTGEDRYLNNDAHVDIESLRAGVTHNLRFSDRVENAVTVYYTGHTTEETFAVGLTDKEGQTFGSRVTLTTDFQGERAALRGITGGEFEKTNAVTKGYALTDLVPGAMRSDLNTHSMQSSLFSQWDLTLPAALTVTGGASVNFIEYTIDDRMANASNPTHLDASGHKTFDAVFAPTLAVRKMFGPDISAYVNVSKGYSPPTSADAVIPYTGEANVDLEPERATQYEIGTKGNLLGRRLSYQLALFRMDVTNKLTPQGVFDDQGSVLYSYTVNGGDQRNQGLEVSAVYALVNDPARTLSVVRPFATYTYSDFTYTDFQSDNNGSSATVDYTGNRVVGVPQNVLDLGLDVGLNSGVYLHTTYQHVDRMPLTYDNRHEAPSFSLLNAKLGITRELGDRLTLDAFVGENNATGSLYYTMVFLNGNYAGAPPNIFLPGPYDAALYGGASVRYRF
jgi:iron complex outermembrane recepter protein